LSIKIGKHFIVFCSTEVVNSHDRIPIVLSEGRAFGSGEHETTRSCLEEMERIPLFFNAKVLDLGCGTGILSIAAAKMGARSVLALDPDLDAIKSTSANIRLNRVEKIIRPLQGEIEIVKGDQFDIILANLFGDILITLLSDIIDCLRSGGLMLLSGVQYEYVFELKVRLNKAGCKLVKNRFLEDYCTMVFKK
jgi:ribosomal protein L11 methyltransferase